MAVPTDAWLLTENYRRWGISTATKHCWCCAPASMPTVARSAPGAAPACLHAGVGAGGGFHLTGCFAVVEDVVAAHLAAAQVLAGVREPGAPLRPFEAFFVTNRLPYTREDAASLGSPPDVRPLVRKYWPEAYEWLCERGFSGGWLPAVYDCTKAERMLGGGRLSFPVVCPTPRPL